MTQKLSGSMEDYLETIYLLGKKRKVVRVRDIAKEMAITMPSVTGALKTLEQLKLVSHPRYDMVFLTSKGNRLARAVYQRHFVLKSFLVNVLGIDPKIAESDACGMEHAVSPQTLERLVLFMKSMNNHERETYG